MNEKIAVIDFETTGIYNAEILQTAIIDENEQSLLYELSRPKKVLRWPDAQRVHGISPETVLHKWPFEFLALKVAELLNAADVVLAYNAQFEIGLLNQYGVMLKHECFIDPMLMFAPIAGEWNNFRQNYRWQKLTTAAAHYGYEFAAHDALADVKATLYIYRRMIEDGVAPVFVPYLGGGGCMIKIEGEQELTFRFAIKTYQEKFNLATFKQAQKLFFEAVLNFDVDLITDYFNKTLGKTVMPN